MGHLPTFSLIIPTRNRGQLLKNCLQSIVNQSYSNWEAIVVDDGSTDNTREVTERFKDSRIRYVYQQHAERGAARNKGVAVARAPFVCFVDDDDYILPDHLSQFHNAIECYGPDIIYRCRYVKKSKKSTSPGPVYDPEKYENSLHFAAFEFCSLCTLCIPKRLLVKELSPIQFPYWEDTHLILRLLPYDKLQQLPSITYIYCQHEKMGSQKIFTVDDTIHKVRLNVLAIRDFFEHHGQVAEKYLPHGTEDFLIAQKYLQHAHEAHKHGHRGIALKLFKNSLKTGFFPRFLGASYAKLFAKMVLFLNR